MHVFAMYCVRNSHCIEHDGDRHFSCTGGQWSGTGVPSRCLQPMQM